MNTANRVRFAVLMRDGFRCRYCGAQPKDAQLTVDHIIPVAKGGPTAEENLVSACMDCNFGKNDGSVDFVPDGPDGAYLFAAPVDAPDEVVQAIDDEAMALQVMLKAAALPNFAVAGYCGISPAYLSRMKGGFRPIPEKLVAPLCAATGSNLLRQFRDLQAAIEGACEVTRLADLLRTAA